MVQWWIHLTWSQAALCLCLAAVSVTVVTLVIIGPSAPPGEVIRPPDPRVNRAGPEAPGKVHYLIDRRHNRRGI